MRFYRPLGTLRAITFDLDDTLYDNRPVIERSERQAVAFLQNYHPSLSALDGGQLRQVRAALRQREPDIYHDVTRWRWRAVEQLLRDRGFGVAEARTGADAAMADFAYWRSRIAVPDETHATLRALGDRWPLAAITNGNASPVECGLDGYFRFVLRAGPDGRAKPFSDLYRLAAQKLALPLESILHVGDDLAADVHGALRCGMSACWINDRGGNFFQAADARLVPHMEISRLASLQALL